VAMSLGMEAAHATAIQNSTGLTAPGTVVNFGPPPVLANGTPLDNIFASQGVTFTNLFADSGFGGAAPHIVAQDAVNFQAGNGGPFTIDFSSDVKSAGFFLGTLPTTTTFEALLDNQVVETATALTDAVNPNNFFGFTGITFDEIEVNIGGTGQGVLDNLEFTSVPEPATPALLGAALLGLGLYRRRLRT
jgi:hypothetical protein